MISAMNTLDIRIWYRHQFPGCELLLVINLNVGSIVKSKRVLLVPSPVDGRRRDGKSFLVGVLSTSNYSHEIFISSSKGFRPSLSFFSPGFDWFALVSFGILRLLSHLYSSQKHSFLRILQRLFRIPVHTPSLLNRKSPCSRPNTTRQAHYSHISCCPLTTYYKATSEYLQAGITSQKAFINTK
jgi:hypothetical protein